MALFKILKGNSATLKNEVKGTEGYAYFTPDDGKFYIDVADTNSPEEVVCGDKAGTNEEGKEVTRICINDDFYILNCGNSSENI